MKPNKMKIEIKQYNNKSRKGQYVYIKEPRKPARLYKWNPKLTIDPYVKYYQDKYVKGSVKGRLSQYKYAYKTYKHKKVSKKKLTPQLQRFQQKLKKTPTLQKTIKKGIAQAITTNYKSITSLGIMKKYKVMLSSLVHDKQLLDIIVTEDNMKKLKMRLENRVEIIGEQGKVIGTTTLNSHTLNECIRRLRQTVKHGEEVKITDYAGLPQRLREQLFSEYTHRTDGKVKNVRITTIFRKGK